MSPVASHSVRMGPCRNDPPLVGAPCGRCCDPTPCGGRCSARSSPRRRRGRSPGRSSCARWSTPATEGTTAGEIARLGRAVPGDRRRHAGDRRHRRASATKLAWGITNELRLDITRHVLGLDHEFHRRHTPGELIQRVDGDVTNVSDFLSQVVPKVFGAMMLVTGMLTVLFVLDWRLGVGMMVYLGIGAALLRQPAPPRRQRVVRRDERLRPPLRRHRGALTAIEDLRSNGAEAHAMWRFVEDSSAALDSSVRRERRLPADVVGGERCRSPSARCCRSSLSALLVERGVITLGTAFLLFQYVQLMTRPARGPRAPAGDGAEGQRGDASRRRPAGASSRRSSTTAPTSPPPGALAVSLPRRRVRLRTTMPDRSSTTSTSRSPAAVRWASSGAPAAARPRSRASLLRLVEPTSGTFASAGSTSPTSRWPSCAGGSRSCPRRSSCSRARSATT